MKRVFAGTCLATMFAVGLAAQTPAGQPPAGQPPAAQKDDKVTVTGCLKAGDQPNTFMLSNAKPDDRGGATGTAGTAGSPSIPSSIKLSGSPVGGKLDEHVGHTIQVTGKLERESPSGAPPSGTAGTAGSRPSGPTLNVDSVKMVSATCDGK